MPEIIAEPAIVFVTGFALVFCVFAIVYRKITRVTRKLDAISQKFDRVVQHPELSKALNEFDQNLLNALVLMENNIVSALDLNAAKSNEAYAENPIQSSGLHTQAPALAEVTIDKKLQNAVAFAKSGYDAQYITGKLNLRPQLVHEIIELHRPN